MKAGKSEEQKKTDPFFYWTGCKSTPFSFGKEERKRLEYKTTAGRQQDFKALKCFISLKNGKNRSIFQMKREER